MVSEKTIQFWEVHMLDMGLLKFREKNSGLFNSLKLMDWPILSDLGGWDRRLPVCLGTASPDCSEAVLLSCPYPF